MNLYVFNATIFDTDNTKPEVFPRLAPYSAIGENKEEAQRQIVQDMFDEEKGGVLAKYSTDKDSATRFNIVFDEAILERPVEWDEELNTWIFADEEVPPEARIAQKEWAVACEKCS